MPAHYTRDLRLSIGGYYGLPKGFSACAPWLTDVERVTLLGNGRWMPTFWRLPQSITSLIMKTDASNLEQVRGILAQLPNLDDLPLSAGFLFR